MDESTTSRKRKRPSYLTEDFATNVSDDEDDIHKKKVVKNIFNSNTNCNILVWWEGWYQISALFLEPSTSRII